MPRIEASPARLARDGCQPGRSLKELGERIQSHWGLCAEASLKHLMANIPESLARDIYRIVHEALIDAARHARASAVRVELTAEGQQVCITVADNGHGFPFRGHYDHAVLIAVNLEPLTLKERIAPLGGILAIDSSKAGACLEITLPLGELGA